MARSVLAIRIYFDGWDTTPMADLCMSDGVVETICWTDVRERREFEKYINGYTLVYDERPKRSWSRWLPTSITAEQEVPE